MRNSKSYDYRRQQSSAPFPNSGSSNEMYSTLHQREQTATSSSSSDRLALVTPFSPTHSRNRTECRPCPTSSSSSSLSHANGRNSTFRTSESSQQPSHRLSSTSSSLQPSRSRTPRSLQPQKPQIPSIRTFTPYRFTPSSASFPTSPHVVPCYSHDRPIFCLAVDTSRNIFVTGSADHSLHAYSLSTGAPVAQLYGKDAGHKEWVTTVDISPHTGRIFSGGMDGIACLWEIPSSMQSTTTTTSLRGKRIEKCFFAGPFAAPVTRVALHDEGHLGMTSSLDGSLVVWDTSVSMGEEKEHEYDFEIDHKNFYTHQKRHQRHQGSLRSESNNITSTPSHLPVVSVIAGPGVRPRSGLGNDVGSHSFYSTSSASTCSFPGITDFQWCSGGMKAFTAERSGSLSLYDITHTSLSSSPLFRISVAPSTETTANAAPFSLYQTPRALCMTALCPTGDLSSQISSSSFSSSSFHPLLLAGTSDGRVVLMDSREGGKKRQERDGTWAYLPRIDRRVCSGSVGSVNTLSPWGYRGGRAHAKPHEVEEEVNRDIKDEKRQKENGSIGWNRNINDHYVAAGLSSGDVSILDARMGFASILTLSGPHSLASTTGGNSRAATKGPILQTKIEKSGDRVYASTAAGEVLCFDVKAAFDDPFLAPKVVDVNGKAMREFSRVDPIWTLCATRGPQTEEAKLVAPQGSTGARGVTCLEVVSRDQEDVTLICAGEDGIPLIATMTL